MRDDGTLPASRVSALWQWGRGGAIGRLRLRRRLRRLLADPDVADLRRVAVLGASGISEPRLRRIFETPDPPPAIRAPKVYVGTYDPRPKPTKSPASLVNENVPVSTDWADAGPP
jgi:hypothetical protein